MGGIFRYRKKGAAGGLIFGLVLIGFPAQCSCAAGAAAGPLEGLIAVMLAMPFIFFGIIFTYKALTTLSISAWDPVKTDRQVKRLLVGGTVAIALTAYAGGLVQRVTGTVPPKPKLESKSVSRPEPQRKVKIAPKPKPKGAAQRKPAQSKKPEPKVPSDLDK